MGEISLNDAQKLVVDHKRGPLLVVAGAGTGKTFVIVERIKKLLDQGVEPKAILAVTFTEKASAEMLDRVLAGREGLLTDMPIMTFNAFGESLLREFGSHIGVGRSFRLLGEQAQLVFVRERIDELKLDYFLPLTASPDAVLSDVLGHFSALKQHVITPETYLKFADSMKTHDEASKLEKKQSQELAKAYQIYLDLCRHENVIDYDDQIYLVIELLTKRPNIQKQLKERFHSIFIDEFQDTNPMQSRLVDMLAGDDQNLVVVGDDDQSIYGFRGATLSNILEFKNRYPKAKDVALIENYRSGQKILDSAYALIQHNNPNRLESTLKINKRLIAEQEGKGPTLRRFEQLNHELSWLAQDIAKRLEAGQSAGSIAVLARSRNTAKKVSNALEQGGVSHQLVGYTQDLYAQPIIRMLVELCRTIAEPGNNNSLHHTLTSDLFNIDNQQIAAHAVKARYEHESLEDLLLTNSTKEIHQAIAVIKTAREEASRLSAGRLVYRVLADSGYKDKLYELAENDSAAGANVQHLSQFFDILKDFESIATQPTVLQFLQALPALQAAGEQTDDGTLAISTDEVLVLTAHKAKGLEWQTVYIPDCTEFSFPLRNSPKVLPIPAELKAASVSLADEHYAEERRLMYVAVTRAREDLILSYSDKHKPGGAMRKPSRFLNEMFGEDSVSTTAITQAGQPDQISLELQTEASPNVVVVPADIYDGNKVYLTVSQAATLLNCPLDFYYKYILRAPQDPNPATAYGTAVHGLIEQINRSRLNGGEPVTLKQLQADLAANWNRAGYASKALADRAFAQANLTIKRFYEKSANSAVPSMVEAPFSADLMPENIVLRGRYDVVFDGENGTEIRDYKTTTSITSEDKAKKRAQASTQLTMYALAWLVDRGELPTLLSLEFVDTDLVGSVRKTLKGVEGLRSKLFEVTIQLREGKFALGNTHDFCIHPK